MRTRQSLVVVMLGALLVVGCNAAAAPEATPHGEEPAHVEPIAGNPDVKLVKLTPRAAERLGIQTVAVAEVDGKLVVPHGAIFWDAEGTPWVYVEEEPLGYVRHELSIESIEDKDAVLTAGPPAGATVVSVGTAELIGTEFEVGH